MWVSDGRASRYSSVRGCQGLSHPPGKTITENFATPAEQRKAEREIETFPVIDSWSDRSSESMKASAALAHRRGHAHVARKKQPKRSRQKSRAKATNLLGQIFAERKQTGSLDLEAVEMGFRAALHQAGAAALSQLLPFAEPCAEQRDMGCPCGHRARYCELRSRPLLTVLGG